MNVSFINAQIEEDFTDEAEEFITSALIALSNSEGLNFCLNIRLTNNAEIASLNSEFRGIERETDVLSFPAYELNRPLKQCIQDIEIEYEGGIPFIGDIAISLERAATQAKEIGNSYLREVVFLSVHGALHLLGYDHTDAASEEIMLDKQRGIMDLINI